MMNRFEITCNHFNQSAALYDSHAKISDEVGRRLLERLSYIKIKPKFILDLGSGTGTFTQSLRKLYPKACIVELDIAYQMLVQSKKKKKWLEKKYLLQANMHHLPFASAQFDLIFMNQALYHCDVLEPLIKEIARVLTPEGCLMFSTLGPDTLVELKNACRMITDNPSSDIFFDMHDIGDCLMQQGFVDPVVDMEYLTVNYQSLDMIARSLQAHGMGHLLCQTPDLDIPARTRKLLTEQLMPPASNEKISMTYEVIYGHAWRAIERKKIVNTETHFEVDYLRKQLKSATTK